MDSPPLHQSVWGGLSISSTCSKCDRVVDVKVLDDGCIVQTTKCSDCANIPVIKDICSTR